MPTPTPSFPFNNTDLHNIYDAIFGAGGGGCDPLAGKLLDGAVDPSTPGGFYPDQYNFMDVELVKIASHTSNTSVSMFNIDTTFLKTVKFGVGSGNTLSYFGGTNKPYVVGGYQEIAGYINGFINNAYLVAIFLLPIQPTGNTTYNWGVIYCNA
jgi:hypothetical protein